MAARWKSGRRNRELRGQAYADYFRCFAAIAAVGRTKDVISDLTDAKTRICVYGSAYVIKQLAEFDRSGGTSKTPEGRIIVARLLEAMRKDVDRGAKLPSSEDIGLVLFGHDWRV